MKTSRFFLGLFLLLGNSCDHGGFPQSYVSYTVANRSDYSLEFITFRTTDGDAELTQTIPLKKSEFFSRDSLLPSDDMYWPTRDVFQGDSIQIVFSDGKLLAFPCMPPACSQVRIIDSQFSTEVLNDPEIDSIFYLYEITNSDYELAE